jgi:hypothetical protein
VEIKIQDLTSAVKRKDELAITIIFNRLMLTYGKDEALIILNKCIDEANIVV